MDVNLDRQSPSPKSIKSLMLLLSGEEFCEYALLDISLGLHQQISGPLSGINEP